MVPKPLLLSIYAFMINIFVHCFVLQLVYSTSFFPSIQLPACFSAAGCLWIPTYCGPDCYWFSVCLGMEQVQSVWRGFDHCTKCATAHACMDTAATRCASPGASYGPMAHVCRRGDTACPACMRSKLYPSYSSLSNVWCLGFDVSGEFVCSGSSQGYK